MATALAGKYWSLSESGTVLTLFGDAVWYDEHTKTMHVGVVPLTVSEHIDTVVVGRIHDARQRGVQIDHVQISSLGGAQLFAGGLLTAEALMAAKEVNLDNWISYIEVTLRLKGETEPCRVRIYNGDAELAVVNLEGETVM